MYQPRIKVAVTPRNVKRLCAVGISQGLHRNGAMNDWYYTPEAIAAISVAYDGQVPVGAAIIMKKDDRPFNDFYKIPINVGVYVKHEMRQMGVGRRLLNKIRRFASDGAIHPWRGDATANSFWAKVQ